MRGFVAEWLPKRRERGLDWKADEGRLNRHVLPYIGDLPIAEVRARHLVDMFHKLRTDPNLNLAPRSIYNIYSVVSAMVRDANPHNQTLSENLHKAIRLVADGVGSRPD